MSGLLFCLARDPAKRGNVLYTRKSYLNFDLELEVRLSRRDNW